MSRFEEAGSSRTGTLFCTEYWESSYDILALESRWGTEFSQARIALSTATHLSFGKFAILAGNARTSLEALMDSGPLALSMENGQTILGTAFGRPGLFH